jgi:nucleoside 2-deoxyribosyltransferase
MKHRTIYSAGPMEHVSADEAQGWRSVVDLQLGSIITHLNPCRRLHNFRPEEMKSIFELDIRDINESDIIIANLDNLKEIPRHGTAMEVFYASYVRRIPVIAFKSSKQHVHPFFESLVTEWRSTVEKACDTIKAKYL